MFRLRTNLLQPVQSLQCFPYTSVLLMPLDQKVAFYNVMLRNKCTMNELNSITVLQCYVLQKSRNNGQWWDIRSAQKLLGTECDCARARLCKSKRSKFTDGCFPGLVLK